MKKFLKKFWKQTVVLFVAVALIMGFLTGNVLCALGSGVFMAVAYNACLLLGKPMDTD